MIGLGSDKNVTCDFVRSIGHQQYCELVLSDVCSFLWQRSEIRPKQVEKGRLKILFKVIIYRIGHLVEEHLEGVNQLVGDALVYSHPGLGKE